MSSVYSWLVSCGDSGVGNENTYYPAEHHHDDQYHSSSSTHLGFTNEDSTVFNDIVEE